MFTLKRLPLLRQWRIVKWSVDLAQSCNFIFLLFCCDVLFTSVATAFSGLSSHQRGILKWLCLQSALQLTLCAFTTLHIGNQPLYLPPTT